MLKIEINQHEGEIMVQACGNLPEIISDLGAVMHTLHVKLCNENIFLGKDFERIFHDPEFLDFVFKPNEDDAKILAAAEDFGKGGSE